MRWFCSVFLLLVAHLLINASPVARRDNSKNKGKDDTNLRKEQRETQQRQKVQVQHVAVNSIRNQNNHDYHEVHQPAHLYPWNEDLFEDSTNAILEKLREEMVLEIKQDSLPAVLRTQSVLQAEVMDAKIKREWERQQQTLARTKRPSSGSHADTNTDTAAAATTATAAAQAPTVEEEERERQKYKHAVNAMINSTAVVRNMFGESFVAHVLYRDDDGNPRFLLRNEAEKKAAEMAQSQGQGDSLWDDSISDDGELLGEPIAAANTGAVSNGEFEVRDPGKGASSAKLGSKVNLPARAPLPVAPTSVERVRARLEGLCLSLPTGYWSYEWCYGRSLRQFHLEQIHTTKSTMNSKSGKSINVEVVNSRRTNDVDLGVFKGTRVGRERGDDLNTSAAITRLVETYNDGPTCNVGSASAVRRSSTVTVQCCANSIEEERLTGPPAGLDASAWYQIQSLIRAPNVPDDPLVLHNTENPGVQPTAVRTVKDSLKRGREHLANYRGQHHPPHDTPHHSGGILDNLVSTGQRLAGVEVFDHWGHLAGFIEPNMCTYHLIACVPLLCSPEAQNGGTNAAAAAAASASSTADSTSSRVIATDSKKKPEEKPTQPKDLLSLVKSLQQQCLVRQEEWWTYELCFKTGIRQFHLQANVVAAAANRVGSTGGGQTQMSVQSEFILGKAPFATYRSLAGLKESVSRGYRSSSGSAMMPDAEVGMPTAVLQRSHRPQTLKLHFEDGTPCDIEDVKRSATVEILCGTDLDAITDIVEDRTCHYHIKVNSALICDLEGFAKPTLKNELVEFVPLEHRETHRFFMQDSLDVDEIRAKADRTRQKIQEGKDRLQEDKARQESNAKIALAEERERRYLQTREAEQAEEQAAEQAVAEQVAAQEKKQDGGSSQALDAGKENCGNFHTE